MSIKPGDTVTHIHGNWDEPQVVERVQGGPVFPDDPIAFFVGGGFWRTSRLVKVEAGDAA